MATKTGYNMSLQSESGAIWNFNVTEEKHEIYSECLIIGYSYKRDLESPLEYYTEALGYNGTIEEMVDYINLKDSKEIYKSPEIQYAFEWETTELREPILEDKVKRALKLEAFLTILDSKMTSF